MKLAHDATAVLKTLADSDAQLAGYIAEIATEQLMGIDPDDVAAEVLLELDFLEVKDVWNQAGASRDGYRGVFWVSSISSCIA